ncbi:outer membrane assembly protein AsmA [Apirhabdus apintestini]|uniref:outer membrane assembly protein AsmA n=1 Tax=Erwinia sp. HR93 TaxID=3094840 RepID=UPI002ADED4C7|nr:outer membrane assembly protein AsmA [Erwinia sp. HR93]MEA1065429.1 outer membrane assembly protein AsmA [Erwinia sp. HR93]WPM85584.1 outer membrane assembly protein AsmA [Enterobacteriaceae bacterium CA-0114]
MRRLLTTLMILLVVLVCGFSALVLFINPNDFRDYMVRNVEQRSGYQLKLEGPLRWHVWPQLSILTGRMALTAPGASQPMVSADNMRLDVALLPLLSHRLEVQQVMLKKGVIQLTPQSEERTPGDAPVAPGASHASIEAQRGWSFDIGRLEVADSVLVFQHADEEQVTVRDINLQMTQDAHRQAQISLSGRVARDQRNLVLHFEGGLDAGDYPRTLSMDVDRFDYQLDGAGFPRQGIKGSGSLNALWDEEAKRLSVTDLLLSANDSQLSGSVSFLPGDKPVWDVSLASDNLNLDALLDRAPTMSSADTDAGERQQPRPVFSNNSDLPHYSALQSFDGEAHFTLRNLRWRGLDFSNVAAQMLNKDGVLTVAQLEGGLGRGRISLPGKVDARSAQPHAEFQADVAGIEIAPVLKAFDYPLAISGLLSLKGQFNGDAVDANAFRRGWRGDASVNLANSRLDGLNVLQLIQRAVASKHNDISGPEDDDNATAMEQFSARARLDSGKLTLEQMAGRSSRLAIGGSGVLDLVKEQCDATFNVRVTGGWQGDKALVDKLKAADIPLRIYGGWQSLSYSLNMDHALRDSLQDEAKRRLKEWAERNPDNRKAKDVQELLKAH